MKARDIRPGDYLPDVHGEVAWTVLEIRDSGAPKLIRTHIERDHDRVTQNLDWPEDEDVPLVRPEGG